MIYENENKNYRLTLGLLDQPVYCAGRQLTGVGNHFEFRVALVKLIILPSKPVIGSLVVESGRGRVEGGGEAIVEGGGRMHRKLGRERESSSW